jgi:hypothetical protein
MAEVPNLIDLQPLAGHAPDVLVMVTLAGRAHVGQEIQDGMLGAAGNAASGIDRIALDKASDDLDPLGCV